MKPQLDSLTASKESFKLLMVIAANCEFELASVDIRATFLLSTVLDHDVFIKPPENIKKAGVISKLKKPLYGLDDASRKFWLHVKEVLLKVGMKVMEGDKALYYLHGDSIITHVDDFTLNGTLEFLTEI